MIRPEKIVRSLPPQEEFKEWEWGDGDLAGFLEHIRVDTAKVITDQIADNCDAYISEASGLFTFLPYGVGCDFAIHFDILKALAEGEIRFDDLKELRAFTDRIDTISENLHKAIKLAESS